jgi:hypothetical protein
MAENQSSVGPDLGFRSLELFYKEALPKFFKSEYAGTYEEKVFNQFKRIGNCNFRKPRVAGLKVPGEVGVV